MEARGGRNICVRCDSVGYNWKQGEGSGIEDSETPQLVAIAVAVAAAATHITVLPKSMLGRFDQTRIQVYRSGMIHKLNLVYAA